MGSVREDIASRERQKFVEDFERRRLETENREQYGLYVQEMRSQALTPLSFDEWKQFLPENENHPVVRGAVASSRANWKKLVETMKERVASTPLDDDELSDLGFDLRFRPIWDNEFTPHGIALMFEKFRDSETRFVPSIHFRP